MGGGEGRVVESTGYRVPTRDDRQSRADVTADPVNTTAYPAGVEGIFWMPRFPLLSSSLSSLSPLFRYSTMATSTAASAVSVPILAFNDVYRVQQRYVPQPGCPDPPDAYPADAEIKVGQFAQLVKDLRAEWPPRKPGLTEGGSDDDGRDGLFLFAGDVFSPSVESSVTRGSHMVSTQAASGASREPLHSHRVLWRVHLASLPHSWNRFGRIPRHASTVKDVWRARRVMWRCSALELSD